MVKERVARGNFCILSVNDPMGYYVGKKIFTHFLFYKIIDNTRYGLELVFSTFDMLFKHINRN